MTRLNHRVLLEQPQDGVDGVGQPLTGWVSLGKRWADVKVLSGLAAIRAGAESSIVKASIRFNHGTNVAAGMRITHDSMVYGVKAVLPAPDRRYVDCVCEAAK